MDALRTHASKREFIVAVVVISGLAGCATTSSNPMPVANTNVAATPEAAQWSPPQVAARGSETHASSATAAPNKGNTWTVLSRIGELDGNSARQDGPGQSFTE
jgi:hypothetical protein